MNAPFRPALKVHLQRRAVLAGLGLLGMAATAPLGLARATTPAGAAAWNTRPTSPPLPACWTA